ncbi:hypothetical protein C5C18_09725 [Rathayibacter tritici]|uniref:hypothetical protein n=1 Tax=Rathayibacter tritici TaxID=33888 RepID=UPI000CE7FCE1|nr:hypothetical protein [Rathayibacter tritici]PPF66082.1 hypothetical protein C5C21_10005 [Rathayibacter tritici]PPG06651.1 hypothetical protein C5C18_09725 [Rathayibacter tritici]
MMATAITSRLEAGEIVPVALWSAFWDRVTDPTSDSADLVAVLTAASAGLPHDETLVSFVRALAAPVVGPRLTAVNIVGIGGGPSTMNISTAAAIVAAAAGVSVVKTGSRAYTSSLGSTELLGRAGVASSTSDEDLERRLTDDGIAFAGQHVYPTQLTRLARRIVPVGLREFGGFLNVVGPFLPHLPVTAMVTGRSERASEATLRALGATDPGRLQWTCSSDAGADELISTSPSRLVHPDGRIEDVLPGDVVSGAGSIDELRAVHPDEAVDHFHRAVSGRLGTALTETILLNAAAVVVAAELEPAFSSAVDRARSALASGAAADLFARLRSGVPAEVRRHA